MTGGMESPQTVVEGEGYCDRGQESSFWLETSQGFWLIGQLETEIPLWQIPADTVCQALGL